MNIADFRVEPADFVADFDDLRFIREEVLITELSRSEASVFDDIDPTCFHFLARDELHQAIGAVRLSPGGQLSHPAVLAPWRHKGVATALTANAIDKARRSGWSKIEVMTQIPFSAFYEKLGFRKHGDVFNVDGFPHQLLTMMIEPLNPLPRRTPKALDTSIPATSILTLDSAVSATIQLIRGARRQLNIYTLDMEYDLYGRSEIIDALKGFAISTRGSVVRIIIHDVPAVQNQAQPIFELAQRLPSSFQFRSPIESEDLKYSSAFLVNDRGGYLFRLFNNRYKGDWSGHAPAKNRQLREEFDRIWQRSRLCTEFRALGI